MSGWVAVAAEDIVKRWQPLTPGQTDIVPTMIADAQDMLETPLIEAGVSDPPPQVAEERWKRAYIRTVAAMVIRVLKNPDGVLSETVDDYTYRYDKAVSSGALYVAAEDLAGLIPVTRRARGAFSIAVRS